jgi:hypothetical protein
LLLMARMQQMLLYTKAFNLQTMQEKRFWDLENQANILMKGKYPGCMEIGDNAYEILQQLPKKGCALQEGENLYYYFFEDLGEFPCTFNNKKAVNWHRRLSLIQVKKDDDTMYMQWRIISGNCGFRGISSWRYGII